MRPELVGLVDGCRIGTDGFSYAGLAQFNSFNNVVWRNDPDHIELSEKEAWRSTMVTSLTGSLFLLTDKPERYRTAFVEPARRAAPVLVTVPGQLYDVDPSRSSELARVDSRGERPRSQAVRRRTHAVRAPLRARGQPAVRVVGGARADGRRRSTRSAGTDIGLDPKKRYTVFEFWERRLLAPDGDSFAPGPIAAAFNSQVFVIRERLPHPQVVATSRHITGGGVDLLDVSWKDGVLSGRSRVVGGEPYEIFVTGERRMAAGGDAVRRRRRRCRCVAARGRGRSPAVPPTTTGEIAWRARFERTPRQCRRLPVADADLASSDPTDRSSDPTARRSDSRRQIRLTVVRTD